MSARADETADLLKTTFEVGDCVWWNQPWSRYHGVTGKVSAVDEGHVFIRWDDGGVGDFNPNPAHGGNIQYVARGEPPPDFKTRRRR